MTLQPAIALTLVTALLAPVNVVAEDHVVTAADLHRQALAATQARQANLDRVRNFFSSEPVTKILERVKIDPARVRKAVPLLTDQELARIAAQSRRVEAEFAAGALSNLHLTYIVIALATAVIVLLIVAD